MGEDMEPTGTTEQTNVEETTEAITDSRHKRKDLTKTERNLGTQI